MPYALQKSLVLRWLQETVGLLQIDGKRPDDVLSVPWQRGKSLFWDFTSRVIHWYSNSSTSGL